MSFLRYSTTADESRPLRVRLEQVLVSQHEPVTLYKLTNLLKFYESTIKQLLPIDCQLVLVLSEVSHLSSKMFLNAYVSPSLHSSLMRCVLQSQCHGDASDREGRYADDGSESLRRTSSNAGVVT